MFALLTGKLAQSQAERSPLVDCLLVHTFVNLCLTADVREPLGAHQLGRVHHRILFFVTHSPGITVNQLLEVMRVTHQNMRGPMRQLIDQGYLISQPCEDDRRQKRNFISAKGLTLINRLSKAQFKRIDRAFVAAGPAAVDGFFKVHACLLDAKDLDWIGRMR